MKYFADCIKSNNSDSADTSSVYSVADSTAIVSASIATPVLGTPHEKINTTRKFTYKPSDNFRESKGRLEVTI
jgi:hypothetical protein